MADLVGIEQMAAQAMAAQSIPIDTSELLNPVIEAIKPIMGTVSALVGGLFGLYLIFILSRLYYEHKKVKLMKDIRFDLDYLNQHFDLPYSQEKGLKNKIIPLVEFEAIRQNKEEKREEKKKKKEEKKKEKEQKIAEKEQGQIKSKSDEHELRLGKNPKKRGKK